MCPVPLSGMTLSEKVKSENRYFGSTVPLSGIKGFRGFYNILISISTPAGKERLVRDSIVLGVVSRRSINLL